MAIEKLTGCSAEMILGLVVCELLDNAINAMSCKGGLLVDIAYLKATNQLQLIVHDSGPGIAVDILPKIFSEGFSTKGVGRGLGLHLVKEAVERLGGRVSCQTDKGAQFTILTPIEQI
jgi:two-component system sensor histidine kinase DcuS/CitB family two-component system sensor histidine kinase MalK